jgi:hypothetical protein
MSESIRTEGGKTYASSTLRRRLLWAFTSEGMGGDHTQSIIDKHFPQDPEEMTVATKADLKG